VRQSFPRALDKIPANGQIMEAMGSDGAKIRAAEPPSDRLATLLRPIGRELKPRHVRLVGPLEPLAR
jgi:hypothetical protein